MRVQEKSAEIGCGRAVEPVAEDGMAKAREMHADLVRSTGADADFEIAEAIECFEQTIFGDGFAAGGNFRGHTNAADRITRDGGDNTAVRLGLAVHQGEIDLLHLARLE